MTRKREERESWMKHPNEVVSFDLYWTSIIRVQIVEVGIVVSRNLASLLKHVVRQFQMFVTLVHWYNTDDPPIQSPIRLYPHDQRPRVVSTKSMTVILKMIMMMPQTPQMSSLSRNK